MRHASTHGPGAAEHFRHENEIFPEFYTDDTHATNQAIIHNLDGVDTFRKGRLRQFIHATIVALDYRRRDLLQARFSLAEKLYKTFNFIRPFEIFFNLIDQCLVLNVV